MRAIECTFPCPWIFLHLLRTSQLRVGSDCVRHHMHFWRTLRSHQWRHFEDCESLSFSWAPSALNGGPIVNGSCMRRNEVEARLEYKDVVGQQGHQCGCSSKSLSHGLNYGNNMKEAGIGFIHKLLLVNTMWMHAASQEHPEKSEDELVS